MSTTFESVHPVLMCRSVGASIVFFGRLGFALSFQDSVTDPRYAGVCRDGVGLHLQWADESQWAYPVDRPVCRFVVADPDALYREFGQAGVLMAAASGSGPWARPADTPWGTREFHLHDPDGNGLQFYRLL